VTDLIRPRLIFSSKVFQVVFVHLVYNSALILTSCWSPFLLNVVANLICIFLLSRQPLLLVILPILLHSFCGQMGVPGCSSEKFHPDVTVFYPFFQGSKIRFHIEEWEEPIHYKLLLFKISGPKLV